MHFDGTLLSWRVGVIEIQRIKTSPPLSFKLLLLAWLPFLKCFEFVIYPLLTAGNLLPALFAWFAYFYFQKYFLDTSKKVRKVQPLFARPRAYKKVELFVHPNTLKIKFCQQNGVVNLIRVTLTTAFVASCYISFNLMLMLRVLCFFKGYQENYFCKNFNLQISNPNIFDYIMSFDKNKFVAELNTNIFRRRYFANKSCWIFSFGLFALCEISSIFCSLY